MPRYPSGENAEIAIRRSVLDQILLRRARSSGAEVREDETLLSLDSDEHWENRDRSERRDRAAPGRGGWAQLQCRAVVQPDAAQRTRPRCPANPPSAAAELWRSHRAAVVARRLFRAGAGRRRICSTFAWSVVLTISPRSSTGRKRNFDLGRSRLANDRATGPRRAARPVSLGCFWSGMPPGWSSRLPAKGFTTHCAPENWRQKPSAAGDHRQYSAAHRKLYAGRLWINASRAMQWNIRV